ncbi:PIN domain-containing protein [Mycolicibacter heraklionensis]|uniref:PIN domain-containing protein n=1 Tax=Mycolicibacter heraklionensis TaxID=512402 RepID=UPI0009EF5797|nr:PIN domain-containing protein [Mycolicibacter heraklionensis]
MTAQGAVAVDTSVAVPLLIGSHEHHAHVAAWAHGQSLCLTGHSLAETYAVLTRLPGDARVSAPDAVRLIDENFAQPLALSVRAARVFHRECAGKGVTGGATYDALVALTAREHRVPLATRDARARSTYEALGVTVLQLPLGPTAR